MKAVSFDAVLCILNPNKTGIFEGNFLFSFSFFLLLEGGQFDPLFIFQEELI